MKPSLRERFLAKATVDLTGPTPVDGAPCWTWSGYVHPKSGYGHISLDGAVVGAHTVGYLLWHGPVPSGLQIDHLCRNRSCVNPAHLEAVTAGENQRRAAGARPPQPPRIRGPHNREKTHCPRGHAYTPANTYMARGKRQCRTCNREAVRRYKQRLEQS